VERTVLSDSIAYILVLALATGFALLMRRLLAKFDEYNLDESDSDGKPTVEELWTRGGYGDPGPGG
jgi:hypothetical protein